MKVKNSILQNYFILNQINYLFFIVEKSLIRLDQRIKNNKIQI